MTDRGRSSARAVGPLLGELAARGLDANAVTSLLRLPAHALDEEGPGLAMEEVRRLWELGAEKLGDPRIGLHLGQKVSRASFDLVSYVAASSATLGEALTRIQRYLGLLTSAVDYELSRHGDVAWLLLHPRSPEIAPIRYADEFSLTARCAYIRQWLGREFRPREVFFRHRLDAVEDLAEYEAFFGCPVATGAPAAGLAFDAAELDAPLVGADPALGRLLTRYAEEALAAMPPQKPLAKRVRELLVQGMEAGELRVADVAKKLAVSERSLQRRLHDEGASFADLLEDVRRELAMRYLRYGQLSMSEVAYLLGYADKAAFFRAFRKWTGETPGTFRAKGS